MPELATAYVLVRPDAKNFKSEALRQLRPQLAGVSAETRRFGGATKGTADDLGRFNRGLLASTASTLGLSRAVGFASTAFIGGVGLGAVIRAATGEFGEMVRVNSEVAAGIKSTGGVANVTAGSIDDLANRTLKLTGIDDELVKQAASVLLTFRRVRNEVGEGNDVFDRAIKSSTDLARRFRSDLGAEAIRLGKALEDPVRGITALRRVGVQFTVAQQKQITGLVNTGQLLTAQKLILREVEVQVGGTAEAFGRTLPGQLNILRETATNTLGDLVRQLSESEQAAGVATQGIQDLRDVFGAVASTIRTVGPPLLDVATAARGVVDAIGVPTILAGVAAYKSVGIITGVAATAQAFYAKTVSSTILPVRAATAANTRLAASVFAVGVNTRGAVAAGGLRAFGAGLLATVGKANLVTLAIAGTAAGLVFLSRRETDWERANERARNSLSLLDGELARSADLRRKLADATDAVQTDKLAVAAAKLGVEQARQALSTETAAQGSLQYRVAQQNLAEALNRLSQAEQQLVDDKGRVIRSEREQAAGARTRRQALRDEIQDTLELGRTAQLELERERDIARVRSTTVPLDSRKVELYTAALEDQSRALKNQTGPSAVAVKSLLAITQAADAIPTAKQIQVIVNAAAAGESLERILILLGLISEASAGLKAAGRVEDIRTRDAQQIIENVREAAKGAKAEQTAAQQALKNVRAIKAERSKALIEARDALTAEREGLQQAREAVLDAQQALADAIRAGNEAVSSAVAQAKQNLNTIGQSLSTAIQEFLSKTGDVEPTGPLAKRFAELRKRILEGSGGPETQRAAQEIAARLQAQQVGRGGQESLDRKVADLTTEFNRGSIGIKTFRARLDKILAELGVTAGRVEQQQGPAAGEEIRALIKGIQEQALAITQGPRRPGAGLEVNIVRPIEALRESQRNIADAQRRLEEAHIGVSKSINSKNAQQLETQRATYALLAVERAEARRHRAFQRAQAKTTRPPAPKPRGGLAAQNALENARAGANSP